MEAGAIVVTMTTSESGLHWLNTFSRLIAGLAAVMAVATWLSTELPLVAKFVFVLLALFGMVLAFAADSEHRPRMLQRLDTRAIEEHLKNALSDYATRLPAGVLSNEIMLNDFVGPNALYIQPPWHSRRQRDFGPLQDHLLSEVTAGRNALLLGEPGSGKTLAMDVLYQRLAHSYIQKAANAPLPIFVRLNRLTETANRAPKSVGELLAIINSYAEYPLPDTRTTRRMLSEGSCVLLLDGLDEMPDHQGRPRLGDHVDPVILAMLSLPSIMTCRSAFHDLFVDGSELDRRFACEATLDPFEFDTNGRDFIHRLAARINVASRAEEAVETVGRDPALKELAQTPLLLFMVTDVILSHLEVGTDAEEWTRGWSLSAIYSRYVAKWVAIEANKANSLGVQLDRENRLDLSRLLAWRLYTERETKAYGQFEQSDLILGRSQIRETVAAWQDTSTVRAVPTETLVDEVCLRNFLIHAGPREKYRFSHKSFFEYFVADHVVTSLEREVRQTMSPRFDLLSDALPDEVIDFIRSILRQATRERRNVHAIRRALYLVASSRSADETDAQLMARQQAANLLPIIADEEALSALRELHDCESSPFVRRGIAVGIALAQGDRTLLDAFVSSIDDDAEAAAVHIGYNRIYFGDQERLTPGWVDDGTSACARIFRATVRQLRHQRYEPIWAMSLMTLRLLEEHPNRSIVQYLSEDGAGDTIAAVCAKDRPDLGPTFRVEQQKLRALPELSGS